MTKKNFYSLLLSMAIIFSLGKSASAQTCSADFSAIISGATATFNGSATGLTPSYAWSFGDGYYAYTLDTEHTYTSNGTYLVCFEVYGADSCYASACDTLEITGIVGGDCSAFFDYNTVDATVSFDNLSDDGGASASYTWSFGDGSSSDIESPTHTYVPGIYTACLTIVTDDSCTSTYCAEVNVGDIIDTMGTCYAYFYYSEVGGFVTFSNLSDGGDGTITDYAWTFGDGSTSILANPSHTYTEGTYNACLTIFTDTGCESSYCSTIYIGGVIDTGFCNADFDVEITGNLASFNDMSTAGAGFIYAYNWNFGDGTTSTLENPSHIYTVAGVYEICLTIYAADSCSNTYCEFINILDGDSTDCNANFNYDFGISPWGIFTTNLSDGGGLATTYSWDFGDGSTSTEFEPTHTYATSGSYNLCLTITTATCTDVYCQIVEIATGIEDESSIGLLQVYPNPAFNTINIYLEPLVSNDITVDIININGSNIHRVFEGNTGELPQTLSTDISALSPGLYFVKVNVANGPQTIFKFIKSQD